MTTEYGIFNGEELVEGQFYSRAIAQTVAAEHLAEDYKGETLEIHEVCPDHPEHGKSWCPTCNADEDSAKIAKRRK